MKKIAYAFALTSLLYSQEYGCIAFDLRDSYNYELKQGNRVVYRGQTNDLERRESEHLRDGKKFTHMKKIGKAKTHSGALKTEKESLKKYRKSHKGKNPIYNKTDHC